MMSLPLFAIAVAAFGVDTTKFVIMGLLPNVARDLGVTIPAAGMLVTSYALGVTIGAPLLSPLLQPHAAPYRVAQSDGAIYCRQCAMPHCRLITPS